MLKGMLLNKQKTGWFVCVSCKQMPQLMEADLKAVCFFLFFILMKAINQSCEASSLSAVQHFRSSTLAETCLKITVSLFRILGIHDNLDRV